MTEYSVPLQVVLDRTGVGGGIVVDLDAFLRFNIQLERSLAALEARFPAPRRGPGAARRSLWNQAAGEEPS